MKVKKKRFENKNIYFKIASQRWRNSVMPVFLSPYKEQPTLFDNDRSFERQINCAICQDPPSNNNKLVISPCGHVFCTECKVSQIASECIVSIINGFTGPKALPHGARVWNFLSFKFNDNCALCRNPSLLELCNDSEVDSLVESWEKLPDNECPQILLTEFLERQKGVFYDLWEKEEKRSDITFFHLMKKRLEGAILPRFFNTSNSLTYASKVKRLQEKFSAFLIDLELAMHVSNETQIEGQLDLLEELVKTKLSDEGIPSEGHRIEVTFDIEGDHSTRKKKFVRVTGATKKQMRKDLLPCLLASVITWHGLKYMRIKRIGLVAQSLAAYVSSYALDHLPEGVCCSNKHKWAGIFLISTFTGLHYLPLKVSLAFSNCLASYHVMKPKHHFF